MMASRARKASRLTSSTFARRHLQNRLVHGASYSRSHDDLARGRVCWAARQDRGGRRDFYWPEAGSEVAQRLRHKLQPSCACRARRPGAVRSTLRRVNRQQLRKVLVHNFDPQARSITDDANFYKTVGKDLAIIARPSITATEEYVRGEASPTRLRASFRSSSAA